MTRAQLYRTLLTTSLAAPVGNPPNPQPTGAATSSMNAIYTLRQFRAALWPYTRLAINYDYWRRTHNPHAMDGGHDYPPERMRRQTMAVRLADPANPAAGWRVVTLNLVPIPFVCPPHHVNLSEFYCN